MEPYDSKNFGLSGIALSKEFYRAADMGNNLDAELISDRKPLIAQGMQIIPAGTTKFKNTENAVFFMELYEPLLAVPDRKDPVEVGVALKIFDRKSNEKKVDTGWIRIPVQEKDTNPVLPVGMKLPVNGLPAGGYRLEISGLDKAGKPITRTTEFEII